MVIPEAGIRFDSRRHGFPHLSRMTIPDSQGTEGQLSKVSMHISMRRKR
jgi:hypothetical protein